MRIHMTCSTSQREDILKQGSTVPVPKSQNLTRFADFPVQTHILNPIWERRAEAGLTLRPPTASGVCMFMYGPGTLALCSLGRSQKEARCPRSQQQRWVNSSLRERRWDISINHR